LQYCKTLLQYCKTLLQVLAAPKCLKFMLNGGFWGIITAINEKGVETRCLASPT
jgi:hypothetical protein